jgi:hypothetical protein
MCPGQRQLPAQQIQMLRHMPIIPDRVPEPILNPARVVSGSVSPARAHVSAETSRLLSCCVRLSPPSSSGRDAAMDWRARSSSGRSWSTVACRNGVGGVEVAVGQVITHPGDLVPGDHGLGIEQVGGQPPSRPRRSSASRSTSLSGRSSPRATLPKTRSPGTPRAAAAATKSCRRRRTRWPTGPDSIFKRRGGLRTAVASSKPVASISAASAPRACCCGPRPGGQVEMLVDCAPLFSYGSMEGTRSYQEEGYERMTVAPAGADLRLEVAVWPPHAGRGPSAYVTLS